MPSIRSPKKTDTIEIRVANEVKAAFAEQCQREGQTVSEAMRAFIDRRLAPHEPARPAPVNRCRIAVAGVIGAALGIGLAAPSLARSVPNGRQDFERLDRDRDGTLTFQEFHPS